MHDVDRFLEAITRDNTRRSYPSAIRHFEVEWGARPRAPTASGGTWPITRKVRLPRNVTLKHGAIDNLGMGAMTMTLRSRTRQR